MKPHHLSSSFRIIACSLLACSWSPFLTAEPSEPESPAGGVIPAVQALVNDNKLDEALAKLQEAIRDPGADPDHPATATLHIAQAGILRNLGRHGEAATAAATAATIYEKAMGADNPFAMNARWLAATQAMRAKQPADAATHAAALLTTFSTYVNSGDAERAQWDGVPQAAPLFKEMPSFNEAGVAAITALLGRAWEAAGETEKALPLLREAIASMERLHGPGHPELVDLTEAEERIAAQRGEALGQRYVGSLGRFSGLVFEGNTIMPADVLRGGLASNVETVYASHPSADLADFLPLLSRQLALGYLNSGFPEAKVDVALDRRPAGNRIIVRIQEGPRYLQGKILIEGAKTIDADKLREVLLAKEDGPRDSSLVSQVRAIMTKEEKWLPKPDSKAAEELLEALNQQLGALKWSFSAGNTEGIDEVKGNTAPLATSLQSAFGSSSTTAEWQPDEPVSFERDKKDPLAASVRRHLAEQGRPLARFRTRYALNGDGTGDLVIQIEDEGPVAVIGRIVTTGGKEHRPEEIISAAGLAQGTPLTPRVLDQAMLALWETGRFYPFSITPVARSADAREVDLLIQVREIPEAPRLDAILPPELEVARRFIRTVNEWMTSGSDGDLLVTHDAGEGRLVLGFSGRGGMLFDAMSKDDAIRATASMDGDGLLIRLTWNDRDSVIRLPMPMEHFRGVGRLMPDPEKSGMRIETLFGIHSSWTSDGLPSTIFILSPALPLIKAADFRVDDEGMVEYADKGVILRLDPATAMPVNSEQTRIEFRPGAVKELQQAVAAELDRPAKDIALDDWIEGARALLRLAEEDGGFEKLDDMELDKWLDLAAALAKPEVTKPFVDLWTRWRESNEDRETFTIPVDPASLQKVGAVNMLVSLGAVSYAEMLAPPDSWVAKLAREVVFIQGGNTRYTNRTMDELFADPDMGPFGCYLTARIMAYFDGNTALRFLHKARAQANAAAFRHDWQLVLDSPTGIGQAVADTIAAIGSISLEQEAEIAALLDPAQAKWLRDFLARYRAKPAAAELAAWLTPRMDDLWEKFLRKGFISGIEDLVNPPPDPKVVAATVDGLPITRAWLQKIESEGYTRVLLPHLKPDPDRPWTQRPMLAETVRMILWKKSWTKNSGALQPAAVDLTPEDFQRIGREATALLGKIPEPADGEVEKWWRKRAPNLGRQCHLHSIRVTAPDQQTESLQRATRIAREAAALLRDGLPMAALITAAAEDKSFNVVASCDKEVTLLDMNPIFYQALMNLKPGEVSSTVGPKTLRWNALLVGWNATPPPSFDAARDSILTAMGAERALQVLQKHLAPLEREADIRVLEAPEPPAEQASVFQDMLKESPESPLARLGVFWQQALAKDPAAAKSFEQVLATGILGATSLEQLESALRDRGLTDLADLAKAAAAKQ